jgi:hypothetical protein
MFLAFAAAAWLAARRGRWWLAGLLGAGAAGTRVTGIPFCIGLIVAYIVARRRSGQPVIAWPALPVLLLPPLPILAFVSYLRVRTGHWDAYTRAMREGWHRGIAWPWEGWSASWDTAFDDAAMSTFVLFFRAEIAAVVLGAVLTIVLACSRRWDEATFLGATTLLMSSTSYYASGVRTILVAFPLYLLLARLAARHRWVAPTYVWLCAPLMATFVIAFTQFHWVD